MSASIALLTFVTLQRLAELVHANRNTKCLLKNGATEAGARHYPFMVAIHACWLAGLWLLASLRPVNLFWFIVFMLLQALRLWVLATLRERWTTRIIVLPYTPRIVAGPYRLLNHPNYVIVTGEIAALPLSFGLPLFAAIFSILNACILFVRIRAENEALRQGEEGRFP